MSSGEEEARTVVGARCVVAVCACALLTLAACGDPVEPRPPTDGGREDACSDDTCVDAHVDCVPQCGERVCGPDPLCHASCGTCEVTESCDGAGACRCIPFCSGRMCGSDGCGGTCGSCGAGATCTADSRCVIGLRPYPGPTASLRLLFSEDRGSSTARRLCVFDADDDDRRPYAVVREIGFDEGPTRAATYAVVPAGVALRVTEHTADGPDPDAPSGCGDRGTSVLIGTGAVGTDPLVADAYYTLVKHTYDTFATGSCTRGAADYCEFSSQPFDIDSPPVPCSTEGIYVFEDGSRVDGRYVAGVRVVNLTSNASRISSSVSSAMTVTHGNAAGGTAVGTEYASPFPTARARFCPDYLACDPAISGTAEANALQACTDGAAKWLLAEVTDARLAAPDRATTIYVFGYAGYLLVPRTPDFDVQIVEADLDVVIAHDITDGPL